MGFPPTALSTKPQALHCSAHYDTAQAKCTWSSQKAKQRGNEAQRPETQGFSRIVFMTLMRKQNTSFFKKYLYYFYLCVYMYVSE